MKMKIWLMVLALSATVYAEWAGPLPWDMKRDFTNWRRCRYPGVDLIGEAMLVRFDPAKTNEYGATATFQFTNMMRGAPGEYVVTIPDSMRDPLNMSFDIAEWNRPRQLGPWRWKVGETYGCLCISDEFKGVRMVDWVVPLDQWGSFKASAEKERAEFEAFVKEKKLECLGLEKKIEGFWDREDLGEEEKEARRGLLSELQTEIHIKVQEKCELYFIRGLHWDELDQAWPIEVDQKEEMKRLLGL